LVALKSQNFRLFFVGYLVSRCGLWFQYIAQAWLVLDLTGSALALGTVSIAQFGPIVLCAPFTGPLIDRFPKRSLLMALQVMSLLVVLAMVCVLLTTHVQLWQLYVLAFLQGTVNAVDQPARQAFLNEIVPREHIESAVGLSSSVLNGSRVVAPALAGLVIVAWGTAWCFILNAIACAVGLIALAAIGRDHMAEARTEVSGDMGQQVFDGLQYVARDIQLLVPLALTALVSTIGLNWQVVLPLFARYTMGSDASGFGALNAILGVGSVVGALIVASRPPADAAGLCKVAAMFAIALFVFSLTPDFISAALLLALAGALGVLFSAGVNTSVQLRSSPEFLARVLSLYFLVWAGGAPIGGAMTGGIAAVWDIRVALAINASLCFVSALCAIAYLRHRQRASAGLPRSA
jgi:MFS family permease